MEEAGEERGDDDVEDVDASEDDELPISVRSVEGPRLSYVA